MSQLSFRGKLPAQASFQLLKVLPTLPKTSFHLKSIPHTHMFRNTGTPPGMIRCCLPYLGLDLTWRPYHIHTCLEIYQLEQHRHLSRYDKGLPTLPRTRFHLKSIPHTHMFRNIPARTTQAPLHPLYVSRRYWVNGANTNVPKQKIQNYEIWNSFWH